MKELGTFSGSKKNFFPSAWIGPKTSSKGELGLKKRFRWVSDLQEVTEKSYGLKKKFSFFGDNFFQRHYRALKPRLNVFLDLIYSKKVVSSISRHILDLKIFDPEKVRNSFTFSRKMSTFPHDFGHKNFLLSNCFTSLSK